MKYLFTNSLPTIPTFHRMLDDTIFAHPFVEGGYGVEGKS